VHDIFGPQMGRYFIDWAVPLAIIFSIPVIGCDWHHHGARPDQALLQATPHADQISVTFGLAIVLQEIIKFYFGANPIPTLPLQPLSHVRTLARCWG